MRRRKLRSSWSQRKPRDAGTISCPLGTWWQALSAQLLLKPKRTGAAASPHHDLPSCLITHLPLQWSQRDLFHKKSKKQGSQLLNLSSLRSVQCGTIPFCYLGCKWEAVGITKVYRKSLDKENLVKNHSFAEKVIDTIQLVHDICLRPPTWKE